MRTIRTGVPVSAATLLLTAFVAWGKAPAPEVNFGNLVEGQTVTSPFVVKMTAKNLVVEPAASGIHEGHGHFHILVDAPAVKAPEAIPFDPQHIHFGKGQTETTLDLPAGEHTLTLQFAKGDHVPYDPLVTRTIHINVVQAKVDSAGAADTAKPAAQ